MSLSPLSNEYVKENDPSICFSISTQLMQNFDGYSQKIIDQFSKNHILLKNVFRKKIPAFIEPNTPFVLPSENFFLQFKKMGIIFKARKNGFGFKIKIEENEEYLNVIYTLLCYLAIFETKTHMPHFNYVKNLFFYSFLLFS